MNATRALLLSMLCALVYTQECQTFQEIYTNGENLCNRMFGEAFVYSENLDNAYTMWFFEKENPNDAVSVRLNKVEAATNTCKLEYFHKEAPSPEPDTFTECHPWKEYSCCHQATVGSVTTIKESYGPEYHWDRCGPLSQACERFFVQEACFYECSPNAGHFRRYPEGSDHPDANSWELYRMPIRADYCNAWFTACQHDKFCSTAGGDFFSCAKEYKEADSGSASSSSQSSKLNTGAIVGISVAACVAALAIVAIIFLIHRERIGKSVFSRLDNNPDAEETAVSH